MPLAFNGTRATTGGDMACCDCSLSVLDMPDVKPCFDYLSSDEKFREASREDQLLSVMLLFVNGYKLPETNE
jgi:hypothetical protein